MINTAIQNIYFYKIIILKINYKTDFINKNFNKILIFIYYNKFEKFFIKKILIFYDLKIFKILITKIFLLIFFIENVSNN